MIIHIWMVLMTGRLCSSVVRRGPHHPRGEEPVSQHHHHYKPNADTPLTQDAQLLHDTRHLAEDTQALTQEALEAMSFEELEFHYFSSHDYDKNNKLDGLELLKAVYHTMEHQDNEAESPLDVDKNDIDGYIELVDRTLKSDDTDGDGYVSYAEYRAVRSKRPRGEPTKTSDHQQQNHIYDEKGHHKEHDAMHQEKGQTYQAHQKHQVQGQLETHPGYKQAQDHTSEVSGNRPTENLHRQVHEHTYQAPNAPNDVPRQDNKPAVREKHVDDKDKPPHEFDDTPDVKLIK